MNSGTTTRIRGRRPALMGALVLLATLATGAAAWEQPAEWVDIGMVSKWQEYDSKFFRVFEDAPFLDQSQFKLNQVKQYAKTHEYNGKMDGITLDTFLTLEAGEQADRRKQAARELKFVGDFHQRMQTLVQRTRQEIESGWGMQVADMTVIGDCLGKLRTAVGLDPSNPYAWHVLGYFANTVGDRTRAKGALAVAEAALAEIPADQLIQLRGEVAMDRAWLLYDVGEFDAAWERLQAAVGFGVKGIEPRLLQGLIAAQQGETQKAIEIANALRSAEVRSFPPNLRSTSFGPEVRNVDAWNKRASSYLQSWILALTWLQQGDPKMAGAAFGKFSVNDLYPFAQRFWNDAGRIYEITGRRSLAEQAWSMARINTPYIVYFVYKPYAGDLGRLTGRPGAVPFFLGFDQFYTTGCRLAHGATLVNRVASVEDEFERQELAMRALDEMDLCLQAGIYPGQAQVLKGQTYYLLGDLGSAILEVEGALEYMDEHGDKAGTAAVLQGLARPDSDLSPTEVANFFSQSGTAAGRWMTTEDREAKLTSLRQAYADDPSDDNRHDLARFLIRNDRVEEGRGLAMGDLKGQELTKDNITQLSGEDLELVLEADRKEGEATLALALVHALEGGATDPWNHSGLWVLAGFICLDAGHMADSKAALERALELNPGNQGLRIQLAIMEGKQSDR